MAVSMRERPIVTGKDAEQFLNRVRANNANMRKTLERKMVAANSHAKAIEYRAKQHTI